MDALKDSNFQIIVATGAINTEGLRDTYHQPNIVIKDYLDFNSVLPFTDLYITNGGYGGVIMSLRYGVPILCAGVTAGKNDVNAHVRYFKVGVDLKTDKPSEVRIKKGVARVFSNGYAENARRIQNILESYEPNKIIENYVFGTDT